MKSGDPSHAHTALRIEAPPAPQPRVLPVSSATPASLSRHPLQRDLCPGLGAPLQGGRSHCGCRGWVTSSLNPLRSPGHVGWDGQRPSPTGARRQGAPQCQCGHGPRCHKRSKKTVSFDSSSQLASGPQSALHVREGQCPAPHTPECLPVLTSQPRGPSTGSVPGPVAKAAWRGGSPT